MKQKNIVLLTVLALFGAMVMTGGSGCGGGTSGPAAPAFTSASYTSVKFGVGGSFQVTATGAQPITFSLTGAPAGVTIDASGLMTIDAAVPAETYDFTITASNITLIDRTQRFTLYVKSEYKVGDIYPHPPGVPQGVVVSVSNDGIDGKIISLDEFVDSWATVNTMNIFTGAIDTQDGQWNTDVIVALNDLANFPAFAWCVNKGSGWYLPARDEFLGIINDLPTINTTLIATVGATEIGVGMGATFSYWTSTEEATNHFFAHVIWFGGLGGSDTSLKEIFPITFNIRAFKAF